MNIKLATVSALAIFTMVNACKKESSKPISTSNTLITSSEEMEPYIQNFIQQGRLRGHDIPDDLNGITYEIKEIEQEGVAGICYWSSSNPNHIIIDKTFWLQFNVDQKEAVLFHELGHCYLERDHLDDALSNGNCQSLMHSGTVQNCKHAYAGSNKTYYLDELFGNHNLN